MSREQEIIQKEDLFESGKAYRNAFFGSGGPPYSGPPQGGGFPGVGPQGGGFEGYGGDPGGNLPVPYGGQSQSSPSSLLGNLPIKDIKAFVDRMGGIEGIMNTITKMNAIMKNVQQMAPMLKLLAGSFLNKKSTTSDNDIDHTARKKRRRRRKRTSNYYKSGRSGYKKRSGYSKAKSRKKS